MNPKLAHHTAAADADTDTGPESDHALPCPQALIASTLALMTTWADPAPGCALDVASLRSLLARKLVSNLFFLAEHPALSPALRQVMAQARARWQGLAHGQSPQAADHAAAHPVSAAGLPPQPLAHVLH